MRGYKIGRLFNIPVELHWSAIVLILMLGFLANTSGLVWYFYLPFGILKGVMLFASVLAHEYGHALWGRRLGYATDRILLMILGGAAMIDARAFDKPKDTIQVSLAGPAVSLALTVLFFGVALSANMLGLPSSNPVADILRFGFAINTILFVFNMLPITPLDGGRVFRAVLTTKFGVLKATDIAFYTTVVLATALGLYSLYTLSFTTVAIAILLIVIAKGERDNTKLQHEVF